MLPLLAPESRRINRIRLEFKDEIQVYFVRSSFLVLIESDWNLKRDWQELVCGVVPVLIESDWNLKFCAKLVKIMPCFVLIESDWNLKLQKQLQLLSFWSVLIESDWNLKRQLWLLHGMGRSGINRIRLEFKDQNLLTNSGHFRPY